MFGISDTVKAILDIVRKFDNIELNDHILRLQTDIAKLMDEDKRLRQELAEYKIRQEQREDLVYREDAYWTKAGVGPYCSRCWDASNKLLCLHEGASRGTFVCPGCGGSIWTEEYRNRRY